MVVSSQSQGGLFSPLNMLPSHFRLGSDNLSQSIIQDSVILALWIEQTSQEVMETMVNSH